jgi:hypothetical protein
MRKSAFPASMFCASLTAALAGWAASSTPAAAGWVNPDTAGYRVSGTCNRFGGIRAANIKFCKPQNSSDFAAANPQTVSLTRPVTRKVPCQAAAAATWSWPWIWLWPHRDCGAASEK